MNIKENIIREAYKYKGTNLAEDLVCTSFIKGFIDDYEYFKENTGDVYQALFFLNEDEAKFFQDNVSFLKENFSTTKPFLFEEGGGFEAWGKLTNKEDIKNSIPSMMRKKNVLPTVESIKKIPGVPEVENFNGPFYLKREDLIKNLGGKNAAKKTLEAAAKAKDSTTAISILKKSVAPKSQEGTATALKSIAGGTPSKGNILGVLGGMWDKIKLFFGSGFKSIGASVSSGNFSNLINIPLVQASLAVGGVALATKLLIKIFGRNKEKQIKASFEKA